MLQYITNASTIDQIVRQVKNVLDGGCRWIQLRMKDAAADEVRQALHSLIPLVRKCEAKLIVDDLVELAAMNGVDGVHLGSNDMSPVEARKLLGTDKLIGYTVNSYEVAQIATYLPVDYYGVGPWRFTTTKKALSPVLGFEGVVKIVSHLKNFTPERPIVVIGGVTLHDVSDILKTDADGVAVSQALSNENAAKETYEFFKKINSK